MNHKDIKNLLSPTLSAIPNGREGAVPECTRLGCCNVQGASSVEFQITSGNPECLQPLFHSSIPNRGGGVSAECAQLVAAKLPAEPDLGLVAKRPIVNVVPISCNVRCTGVVESRFAAEKDSPAFRGVRAVPARRHFRTYSNLRFDQAQSCFGSFCERGPLALQVSRQKPGTVASSVPATVRGRCFPCQIEFSQINLR